MNGISLTKENQMDPVSLIALFTAFFTALAGFMKSRSQDTNTNVLAMKVKLIEDQLVDCKREREMLRKIFDELGL